MIPGDSGPKPRVDQLPELQRRAVIQALMNEVPLRKVAKMAGCSLGAIHDYKRKYIIPQLQTPHENLIDQQTRELPKLSKEDKIELKAEQNPERHEQLRTNVQRSQVKEVLRASPVKRRVEKLWHFTAKNLQRASKATTKDGKQDFTPLPGLLNQAHKNLELQGKLSGEIGSGSSGPSVAIQIVYPGAEPPAREATIIDVTAGTKIGSRNSR
jgi:hypothetical protein